MSQQIAREYADYAACSVMQDLARAAHGDDYLGQSSSASPGDLLRIVDRLNLCPNEHILDLGCGSGSFSRLLARSRKLRVTGIDLAEDLIVTARKIAAVDEKLAELAFRCGDFCRDPLADELADALVCVGSLYWGVEIDDALSHWNSWLRPRARLAILLNVQVAPMPPSTTRWLGDTRFLENDLLLASLARHGWEPSIEDGNARYIVWLQRWCAAMKTSIDRLVEAFGNTKANALMARFHTYLDLALGGWTKRVNITAERSR
jgi:SAM-dependent methyltransferase